MGGGRHVDPDRATFWRSLVAAAAKAGLAVAIVAGLTGVAVLWSMRADPATVAAPEPAPTPPPAADRVTEPAAPSPTREPLGQATPERVEATATPTGPEDVDPPGREPTDVTVQVLDGGAGQGDVQDVVATVEEMGYVVVAVNVARCCYERTTVFFTNGEEEQAEGLRARDARFAVVDANPNLSEEVDIHVVVGEDWETG